jgi:enterobactin synthetase component D
VTESPNPDILRKAVGHFSVELGSPEAWVSRARELIGQELPAELERAIPSRQAEYLAGRYCALRALEQAGAPPTAPLTDGRLPLWPSGYVGSITHKRGFASAAIGRAGELAGIGIDCESEMSDAEAGRIQDAISSGGDRSLQPAGVSLGTYLSLVFSAKECLYKALFPEVRIFFGFADAELLRVDWAAREFELQLLKELSPARPRGARFPGRFALAPGRIHAGLEIPKLV